MASKNEIKVIEVDSTDTGNRLDIFLAKKLSKTRSQISKMVINKTILLNNNVDFKAGILLKPNDQIIITEKLVKELSLQVPSLKILFEDADLLAIEKPAGILSHPTERHETNTVLDFIKEKYPQNFEFDFRGGLVHRLDKDTSGILLIAKNMQSFENLKKVFKARKIVKKYIALVAGKLPSKSGIIEAPIGRAKSETVKMQVVSEEETPLSLTKFWVKNEYKGLSLLEIELVTGRTHQIRVHLASIGHPVIGDKLYLNKQNMALSAKYGLKRQVLHAHQVQFKLGTKKYDICSELSIDLQQTLERIQNDQ